MPVSQLTTLEVNDAETPADPGTVPGTAALTRGTSVLRAIASKDRAPSFFHPLRTTRLPGDTLHRMLEALIAEGLVRHHPELSP